MVKIDLDKMINTLYDFVYNKNKNSCLETKNLEDINDIDTLKFTYKYREESDNIISNILNKKMKLVDINENEFTFKRYSDSTLPLMVIIGSYNKKNRNINDLNRTENVEISIAYLLSGLVVNKINNHILLPIINIDVKISQLSDIINTYTSMKRLNDLHKKNKINDDLYIHCKEHFYKLDTLNKYLKSLSSEKYTSILKPIIFQVLFSLYKIQNKYENFRHNNLTTNSIYLYFKKDVNEIYEINQIKFNVSNKNLVKIAKFDHSSIEKLVYNDDVEQNINIPHGNKKNKYYDIYTFFKDLKNIYDKDFKTKDETYEFIHKIIPEKFKNEYNGLDEYTTPEKLLENEYFNDLIEEQIGGDTSQSEIYNNYKTELGDSDKDIIIKKISNKTNRKKVLQIGGRKKIKGSRKISKKKNKKEKKNNNNNNNNKIGELLGYSSTDQNKMSDMMPQNMGQPMMPQNMGQPMMPQNMGQPMMPQNMGQPMMPQNMGQQIGGARKVKGNRKLSNKKKKRKNIENKNNNKTNKIGEILGLSSIEDKSSLDITSYNGNHEQMMSQQMMPPQMMSQQMMPQQMMSQQMMPQQMMSEQMMPQQMMSEQMMPQQMMSEQMMPQQMMHQQMMPQQMMPQQMMPEQMMPQQMMPEQMMPQQMMPQQMMSQQMMPQQTMPHQMGGSSKYNGKRKIYKKNKKNKKNTKQTNKIGSLLGVTSSDSSENIIQNKNSINNEMMSYQMMPNQMMPNQMMPNQMMPNQMMPNQMMPNQMMHNQMMPNQMMPNQMMHNQMNSKYQNVLPENISDMELQNIQELGPNIGELENNLKNLDINENNNDIKNNRPEIGLRGGGLKSQKGGNIVKAPYKKERNAPYFSNDEKNVYNRKKKERGPPREPPVLLEQKIYDPSGPKSKPPHMQTYPPAHVPVPNPYYPLMNPMYAYGYKPNKIPVQKVYNVSLANPGGDFSSLSVLYEDMMPGKDFSYSFNTLNERISIIHFLRSTLITRGDGEIMNITGGKNSLLSYIKLLELNPYNQRKYGGNPYANLPDNMLLYRAAYPIRYEKDIVSVAKDSTALNVRIYELSKAALDAETINALFSKNHFDVWREIEYYEFVREEIIKKHLCPNFISMVLYKKDTKSNINFSKLRVIKRQNNSVYAKDRDIINREQINNQHNIIHPGRNMNLRNRQDVNNLRTDDITSKENTKNILRRLTNYTNDRINEIIENLPYTIPITDLIIGKNEAKLLLINNNIRHELIENNVRETRIIINDYNRTKIDMAKASNTCIVAVTEAPTNNFYAWSSRVYENYGSIKKMVSTGYHSTEVWISIIFQLVAAMSVLQDKKIHFNEFSLANNIYIRDIYSNTDFLGYWKYVIDGVSYYIPNYGYLLVIDSNYVDLTNRQVFDAHEDGVPQQNKIISTIFGSINNDVIKPNPTENDIKSMCYQDFKNAVNPNNFSLEKEQNGFIKPSALVMNLLSNMYLDDITNVKDYIFKYMKQFLNNRIGTYLTNGEVEDIVNTYRPSFKKGEMAIMIAGYNTYKWCMYLEPDNIPGIRNRHKVLSKNNPNDTEIIETSITFGNLRKFRSIQSIQQDFNSKKANLNEDALLETYIID
jgi:hypothetical protein